MEGSGMMQVFSLPNFENKEDKANKEWFLYQKDGNSSLRIASRLMRIVNRLGSDQTRSGISRVVCSIIT